MTVRVTDWVRVSDGRIVERILSKEDSEVSKHVDTEKNPEENCTAIERLRSIRGR